jgi:hypothetical protein
MEQLSVADRLRGMADMRTVRKLIATSAALALVASSTAAAAAQSPQRINPWAILAATSGAAPATVMCGSAAATAQGPTGCVLPTLDAAAPPPPPVRVAPAAPPPAYAGAGLSGELLPFILWFGLIAIALATSGSSRPNSPA